MVESERSIVIIHYTGGSPSNDYYFIGSSREAIAADALKIVRKPARLVEEISMARAAELNLEYLEAGTEAVRRGCESYLLGRPQGTGVRALLSTK